ncbi:hypothetical protein MMC14_009188 [Varicellaria rhodocarpa]|nr:hypothetical protein [Varicellaria rhodocarpa]
METLATFHITHLPTELAVYIALFRGLRNASFLRQQLLDGNTEYEYAFLDAASILSTTHVLAAVFRAVNDMQSQRMKSRNVHSETVFALSPNNNIAESFRRFGLTEITTDLLVVKLSTFTDITFQSMSRHLKRVIEGVPVQFNDAELQQITDTAKLRKAYKLAPPKQNTPLGGANGGAALRSPEDGEVERRELEALILGLMALRGAT